MNRSDFPAIVIPKTLEEHLKWQCDNYNKSVGDMNLQDDYDCFECLNRGNFEVIDYKNLTTFKKDCRCMKIRRNILRFRQSGFGDSARNFTFEKYTTNEEWQKVAKQKAMQYVRNYSGKWLFFHGQSGCGKTHLCTAICMELIKKEHDVEYVSWRKLVHFFEGNRFNEENYSGKIRELQEVEILYIDDFLKTACKDNNGKIRPSENELNMAYEIVDSRVNSGKCMIISSELSISDIASLEIATGGRISEKSTGNQILVKYGENRNYRFHGKE
ncbi:MAG: ATP-binding protein [Ruminococcus sp.]|nr:ATP-binding protein [Ruminococcus sp.]